MKTLKILLVAGFAAVSVGIAVPVASAAELGLESAPKPAVHRKVVHHRRVHHRGRVVADYDGSPIILRRHPRETVVVMGPDGTQFVRPVYDAISVPGAIPSRYFNGERVGPRTTRWSYR